MQDSTPLPYRLTNDYLFRAVFQSRPKALVELCRSVLHLFPEDNVTVELRNPIILGQKIDNKEFILDLAVTINDSIYLNLEMQMYHDHHWIKRSLSYTCRSFDNLNREAIMEQTVCKFRFSETICISNILKKQNITVTASSVSLGKSFQIRQQCQAREDFEYWKRIKENGTTGPNESTFVRLSRIVSAVIFHP